jgi:thiamine kinase-like enzyme
MKTKAEIRKEHPVFRGCLKYFPDALLEISNVSFVGNEQHNPGTELHWDRAKSRDEADALVRHLLDSGKRDDDGLRHTAKMAWRGLAMLQKEIEEDRLKNEKQ